MDEEKFFKEAEKVAGTSTCLKIKNGAVVVQDGQIVGKGTNLCSPVAFHHGKKVRSCARMGLPSGAKYELCKPLHAELMAVLNTGLEKCRRATIYFFGHYYACWHCESVTNYAGIKEIKFRGEVGRNYYQKLEDQNSERSQDDTHQKRDS